MTALSLASRDYVLTLADDEHMVGARHTGWIGLGPFLEEDLAFCSIAQDELGHAIALYRLVTGEDAAVDELALRRSPDEYRSSWLAEWPCADWASALVRHWLYDRAEELRWENVAGSSIEGLAELVPLARREEAFHMRHADQLLTRVMADHSATTVVLAAARELRPLAATLWVPPLEEAAALEEGVAARPFAELAADWERGVDADLLRWGADPAASQGPAVELPADRRVRSEHFAEFHAGLNEVVSIDPTAVW
ncbi:MAG: 1,2-phenylacetyl-CoA epoxidase subunit PaaC [Ilumatobacteraceae bacterium]